MKPIMHKYEIYIDFENNYDMILMKYERYYTFERNKEEK